MYNYSPQTCLIKDIDGKIYNIIDLWQGKKVPVDLTTIQYSYAPKSCLVQNVDGTNVNVIDTILAVANGSGSGTSSLEEVIQARGKYSTLGERLDKDNEKVYETINDKDFISFEGEDIKVEHSKIGFTKDMQIEGMTYQNLIKSNVEIGRINSDTGIKFVSIPLLFAKPNTTYTLIFNIKENTTTTNATNFGVYLDGAMHSSEVIYAGSTSMGITQAGRVGLCKYTFTSIGNIPENPMISLGFHEDYGLNYTLTINNIMLLEGDYTQPNSYMPEYFEGIKSVGEKEGKISILSRNKNLFDESTLQSYLVDEWYNFESEGNSRSNSNFMIYEEKDVNSKVIMRGNRANEKAFTTTNKEKYYCQIGLNGDVKDNKIWLDIKLKPNTNYIMSTQFDESIVNCVKFKNIQINEGNKKLQYEKQKTDKKEILIPYEFGFKGLPSGAKDLIFNKDDGCYVKQNIDKKLFNGSENEQWRVYEAGSNEIFVRFVCSNSLLPIKNVLNIICNNFTVYNYGGSNPTQEGIFLDNQSNWNVQIYIKRSKLETQDVAGFKKWLQANPVTVYYELDEPIEYKITDLNSINLETFKDVTYISSENEIQPNLSFKAPVDVQATISTLRENNAQLSNELEVKTQELQEKDKELANEDDLLTAKDLDMDFRIFELEEQLTPEIAKLSMSHNSPYPMIKRCIEKGLYEKEDMLYKMNRYLHGKRLTQEEYDELKLMMG